MEICAETGHIYGIQNSRNTVKKYEKTAEQHRVRYCSRPLEGRDSNLRSPMLNSLREWGERRLTRVFALETMQKHLEFRWVCTVTRVQKYSGNCRFADCFFRDRQYNRIYGV